MKSIFLLILVMVFSTGCANFGKKMKTLVSGKAEAPLAVRSKSTPKFSEKPYYYSGPKRQYKRQTKKTIEESSNLDASTGSLWVMEGQGSYLFSQNVVRMIGDSTSIRIEGEPKEQLQAKAQIINDLLKKLEERKMAAQRRVASKPAVQSKVAAQKTSTGPQAVIGGQKAKLEDVFNVNVVPTRITERMIDGNYRVKGSQPFMIGKREYKVIVTGIVRSQDFNEEGVSAVKLLDPGFDIVSTRRSSASL